MLLLMISGCGNKGKQSGEYQIFYLNMENTKLVPEFYDSTGATGEELVAELIERLSSAPDSSKLRRTIPENVLVQDFKIDGAWLTIDFSKEYNNLTPTQEVLVRAAIVRTLLQENSFSLIAFTVDSEPLRTKSGFLVGSMNKDSFIENPGEQINSSVETTIGLYFSSEDGTQIVKENRQVHYSTNISIEKLIMEQLIEGPKKSGAKATIPSETKIITITVAEGVCYVNLDNTFQNQNPEIKEEVVLYSIVNSLTELQGVTKVQISINGDTKGKCRYTYELSNMYEYNKNLLMPQE